YIASDPARLELSLLSLHDALPIFVSPLLALMRDQIGAAQRAGIRAVTINSANAIEWGQVREQLRADEVDVLLVSPERLNNPRFRDRKSTRLNSSHVSISYAVFCLK